MLAGWLILIFKSSLIAPSGKAKKHRDQLLKKGFDFEYFTHIYTTKNGDQYRFCYEPGFKDIGNDFYLIVTRDAS